MSDTALLEALRSAVAFQPQGERVFNLSWGRGTLDGKPVRVALVENRFASGSIGVAEAERMAALFKVVAKERSALVLYLDSAGAKVSPRGRARRVSAVYRPPRGRRKRATSRLSSEQLLRCSSCSRTAPATLFGRRPASEVGPARSGGGDGRVSTSVPRDVEATLASSARPMPVPRNSVWQPAGFAPWFARACHKSARTAPRGTRPAPRERARAA